jgi:holo-ACP synthase / triphosphoribosyl-dephospho-CoA synthase
MNIDEVRNRILGAREKRAYLRDQCSQSGCNSLSISLNVPGYPKSTSLFSAFFDDVLSECKQLLQAHRTAIDTAHEIKQTDEAGDFYLVPLFDVRSLAAIKTMTETFEERHPLGRIIDIDIVNRELQPVSSGKLKQCLLCEKPAIVCMREANHTNEVLREHLTHGIRRFLTQKASRRICRQLAALALKAILYEISASPKPGLVGRFEQGAHHDMDYFTFIDSTSVLAGYFEELIQLAYAFSGNDLRAALPVIRAVGLKMETSMFAATKGVNTQKGLIFLIGLALFSAARCLACDRVFSAARCRETISAICANLVQNELMAATNDEKTHGQICFQRYGLEGAGVRKEAEAGLPAVFEQGLPELTSALAGSDASASPARINRALIKALLRLMTVTNDTNILFRKDLQTLRTVQYMAQHVLDAADRAAEDERYEALLAYCRREHISPGGSADLLAVAVFIYFVERFFPSTTDIINMD